MLQRTQVLYFTSFKFQLQLQEQKDPDVCIYCHKFDVVRCDAKFQPLEDAIVPFDITIVSVCTN